MSSKWRSERSSSEPIVFYIRIILLFVYSGSLEARKAKQRPGSPEDLGTFQVLSNYFASKAFTTQEYISYIHMFAISSYLFTTCWLLRMCKRMWRLTHPIMVQFTYSHTYGNKYFMFWIVYDIWHAAKARCSRHCDPLGIPSSWASPLPGTGWARNE